MFAAIILLRHVGEVFHIGDVEKFTGDAGLRRLLLHVCLVRCGTVLLVGFSASLLVHAYRQAFTLCDSVLNALPVVLWRKNRKGTFTYANDHLCAIVGRDFHEIIGSNDRLLFGDEFASRFEQGDAYAMTNPEGFVDVSEPFLRPDGSLQYNYVRKVALTARDGRIEGTQGFFIDASRLPVSVLDEALLSSLASEARTISHDIGNRMVTVALSAQAAEDLLGQYNQKDAVVGEVKGLLNTVRKLIADIVDRVESVGRSKRTGVRSEVFDIGDVVQSELAAMRVRLQRYRCELKVNPGGFKVKGDRTQVCDAVSNLLLNAKEGIDRYCAKHGRNVKTAFRILVKKSTKQRCVDICVMNTGELDSQQILMLKTGVTLSLKPEATGHGLGLPIIRECARLHGGSFEIDRFASGSLIVSTLTLSCTKT